MQIWTKIENPNAREPFELALASLLYVFAFLLGILYLFLIILALFKIATKTINLFAFKVALVFGAAIVITLGIIIEIEFGFALGFGFIFALEFGFALGFGFIFALEFGIATGIISIMLLGILGSYIAGLKRSKTRLK